MRRKFLSVVLCVCMMLTMAPFAFAAGDDSTTESAISSGGASGGGSVTPVAQVGDTTYGTLRAAVAAVQDGGTVKLLRDAIGAGIGTYEIAGTDNQSNTKITSKSFTIDFNGHTYSLNAPAVGSTGYETQGFHFEWSGSADSIPNITLKNGTLDVASEHDSDMKLLIQNYCNLTLDNMVVDGSNLEKGWGTYTYITSNCCGTTVIKDTKIFGGDAQENVAFDVDGCRSAYANTPVKITVEGNSEILGRIEVNDSDNKSENTLTVKGGSFSDVATAVKYAENNATIKVAQDTTSDVVVPADKTITLDLNGNKLTNKTNHTILNNGTLTITGTGTVDNVTHQKAALYNKGTAIVEGGTFDRSKENGQTKAESGNNSWYTIKNVGTMTIKDGATVQTAGNNNSLGKFSSLVSNGYFDSADFTNNKGIDNPVLTIEGGLFCGGLNTIKNDDRANLTINNGTFSNYYQAVVQNHNVAEIKGGTFTAASDSNDVTYGVYNCGCDAQIDLGTLTISDGTFTGATYGVYDISTKSPTITISGGKFSGKKAAIAKSISGDYISNATFSVTGGLFSSDPTPYCGTKNDKQFTGVASNDSTYPYTVGEKNAESKPATVDSATVPANTTSTDPIVKEAAEKISGATLGNSNSIEAATKNEANNNKITADTPVGSSSTVLDSLKTISSNSNIQSTDVAIVYQTYVDVSVTNAKKDSSNLTELTVNLTPMYRVIATTKNVAESTSTEIKLDGEDTNAILIENAKKLNVPAQAYEVTLALPSGFANKDDKLSIKHTKGDGSVEYYTGTVSEASSSSETTKPIFVTFTTNGFSPFTIYASSASVASIGSDENEKVYPTLQAAIDAANDNDTITLKQDCAENVTVSKNLKFTLANTGKFSGSINAGSRYNVTSAAGAAANTTDYTVTYVSGSSSGSISAPTTYAVNVNAATNGAVAADKKTASKGTTVTVTASPSKGYVVDAVKVVDKDGKDVAVTEKDGKYVFTMPAYAVTVTGSFKAETSAPVALPFTDVKSGNWFYDAVKYAYAQGLMTGTSATTFAPNGTMNRAMIVTVLYRLEKSPAVTGASKFTDVPAGQWYSDAVAWAAANKIVNGYDETTFGPMNAVTREQMAAILFRYEQVKGLENVTLEENLNRFPDQDKISAYAIPALQWAVGQKIINGNANGTLDPTGTATRAQVAQIFTNLLNK